MSGTFGSRLRWALVLGATVCGAASAVAAHGQTPSTPMGTLTVRDVRVGSSIPIEGFRSTLAIGRQGHVAFNGTWDGPVDLTTRLAPGRWRITRSERTCDGSCAQLDAPTVSCSRTVTVHRGAHVTVTVLVNHAKPHCRTRVSGS